jgi:hypothetical protein
MTGNEFEYLVLGGSLASAHLFGLEVLVEKVKSSLVGLGTTHDREHTFSGIIMRS